MMANGSAIGGDRARAVMGARLGVGLAQGLALYGLSQAAAHKVWPATNAGLLEALAFAVCYTPFILLEGLGNLRRYTLIAWTAVAALVFAGLAWHDAASRSTDVAVYTNHFLAGPFALALFGAAAMFIAHHLIEAADIEQRPVAHYGLYFDLAWKHAVQLALAAAFVGVFWAGLELGAALFKLIKIDALFELINKPWFALPTTGVALAAAIHLTDVRHGLIRGVRTVGLTLLSWLLPLMTLIAVAFLAALPFTGLAPLWATRSAGSALLSAAALLIILINATYQDGAPDTPAPVILRWSARAAALALVPLAAIAGYGLWLRIGQYGLTPERVAAVACFVVASGYALGYAAAAVWPGPWLKRLEATNIATAVVVIAVILALFSPLADPARISVADQVKRLEDGRIAPDKFDYEFLRFRSGRYGNEALKARTAGPNAAAISKRAAAALAQTGPTYAGVTTSSMPLAERITVYPKGGTLPASFLGQDWSSTFAGPPCLTSQNSCDGFVVDMDGGGTPEILLTSGDEITVFKAGADGVWAMAGTLAPDCPTTLDAMKAGRMQAVAPQPSPWRDLDVGGNRLHLVAPPDACQAVAKR